MNRAYDDFLNLRCDTAIREVRDGWYTFEDTVFYGEKGGALADEGTINGQRVTGLRWEGDVLWHQVEGTLQDPIHMEVDRVTRWNNTAVQSAFHMLDGYYGRMGLHIVAIGVHPENQWYELDTKELPPGHLEEVQAFLDKQIMDNLKTELTYVKGADYPDPKYQGYDEVRIVKFGDVDVQPCGTPHVGQTRDILTFTVLGSEHSGRGTKVYVACGPAASPRLAHCYDLLRRMAHTATTGMEDLPEKVESLLATSKALKKENDELRRALYGHIAEGLLATGETVVEYPARDANELRSVGQALLGRADRDVVVAAALEGGTAFAAVSPSGKARAWMEQLQGETEASGGGSPKMVSGKTPISLPKFIDIASGLAF